MSSETKDERERSWACRLFCHNLFDRNNNQIYKITCSRPSYKTSSCSILFSTVDGYCQSLLVQVTRSVHVVILTINGVHDCISRSTT